MLRVDREAGRDGVVVKIIFTLIPIEGVGIIGKICLENIQQPVAIEIAGSRSHARLLSSIFVIGDPCTNADLLESLSAEVVVIQAGGRVAGHEDVRPAVVIEVSGQRGESVIALRARDLDAVGNICEMSVSAVLIEG